MEYKLAIKKLFDNHGLEIFSNPFLAMSILSDYIGNDIYSQRLLKVLYILYPSIDIVELFKVRSIKDGREQLKKVYPSFKDKMTTKEFCDAINPISKYIRPDEFTTKQTGKPKIAAANAVAVCHKGVKVKLTNQVPQLTPSQFHQQVNQRIINAKNAVNNSPKPATFNTQAFHSNSNVLKGNQWQLLANTITNPNNKPKAKRTTKKNFTAMMVTATCKNFKCTIWPNSSFQVFVDGVLDQGLTKKAFIAGGVLVSTIMRPGKEVEVIIPDNSYKTLSFILDCGFVYLGDSQNYKFRGYNLDVNNDHGFLFVYSNIDTLNITQGQGNVFIEGEMKNVNVTQQSGKGTWMLKTNNTRNLNINWTNGCGDIEGWFMNGKLRPNPVSLFSKSKTISTVGLVNATKVLLNVTTNRGRIKIK